MSAINTTINITRDAGTVDNVDLSSLREAIQTTLQDNFYKILSRNKIETISSLTGDTSKAVNIAISKDDNIITISYTGNSEPLTTIEYMPYISYVKYSQYVSSVGEPNSGLTEITNKYRPVATVLLNILIDGNISGFSILSPQDIQLIDDSEGIYRIKSDIDYNIYYGESVNTDNDIEPLDLPEIIKLQSAVINDKNSYYEVFYSDIEDPYTVNKVPCVDGTVYYNDGNYSFKSLFGDLYTNFAQSGTGEDSSVIGSVLMNNKLLCVSNVINGSKVVSNQIQGFSSNIFDCPALDVPDYWIQDNQLNIGSTITIDNSDYIISDKNTLIQLTNTEIYGINTTVIYDGKPHFFGLVYPQGSTAYYKQSDNPEDEWKLLPTDTSTITTYKDAQNYKFDYKVVISDSDTDKREFYGNVELNILPANQYGYVVNTYNDFYDALPHTVYIYTDAEVQFSMDNVNWSNTAPVFTNVGNYTVYYRLIKNNYITVYDSAVLSINAISNEDSINDDIDVSKNIIVIRSQLYSNTNSTTFIYTNTNRVYISDSEPTSIDVSNFNGEFPNPNTTTEVTTELGRFTVSPGHYFMVIESYCPWYYQGKEPKQDQGTKTIDEMLTTNPLTYTVQYSNKENPTEADWLSLGGQYLQPSNGFYQYAITNIEPKFKTNSTTDDNYVGYLWDYKNNASMKAKSTKRLVVELPLATVNAGNNTKTIRILCTQSAGTHTNEYSKEFVKYPNINSLGISLISMTEYETPSSLNINAQNSTIGIKFKSSLTQNAWFAFNSGDNLSCSGGAVLGTGSNTEFDDMANIKFRNIDDPNSSSIWDAGDATTNKPFKLVNKYLARLQFNSNQFSTSDISAYAITTTNTNKIYGYLPCNS